MGGQKERESSSCPSPPCHPHHGAHTGERVWGRAQWDLQVVSLHGPASAATGPHVRGDAPGWAR